MTSTVLFDVPGPQARRRHNIGTFVGGLVVLGLIGLVLWRLGVNGQLEAERWAILFDPSTNVPQALGEALVNTLQVAAVAMVAATILGAFLAVGRISDHVWLRVPVTLIVEFFRAVPLLVLILFCLLFLPTVGVPMTAFRALALGLTLYNMAVLAEIFRAGILAVDRGQYEAAAALGLREGTAMRSVILPQAIRLVVPTLVTQLVALLKDSTLGYVVSYPELLKQANNLTVFTHLLVQTYLIVAAVYVVMNLLLSRLAVWLERRLGTRTRSRAAGGAAEGAPTGDAARPEGVPQTMA